MYTAQALWTQTRERLRVIDLIFRNKRLSEVFESALAGEGPYLIEVMMPIPRARD